MKKYCICFFRVSTQQQDLNQQRDAIISEAIKLGYALDHQIVIEYKESGISLSSNERAGIDKLKETISTNPDVDCVICWELSRIGRRADVIFDIRDFFLKYKVQWVVMTPYMRLLEEDGKMSQTSSLMLSIFTSLAESEMAIAKERFARGKARSKELGKYTGGHVQFGYSIDDNKLIQIDEKSSSVVKQMFEMYSTGQYSMSSLADELMEYGYFENFSNKRAVMSFLYKHLKHENYCGCNNRPAIISRELFDKVQTVMKNNYLSLKPGNKGEVLCKRLLYNVDGYCLTPQIVSQQGNNEKYVIYTSGFGYGVNASIAKNTIDPLVWEFAKSIHRKYLTEEKDIKKQQTEMCEILTKKYKVAKEKSAKIQEKIDRTEERYIHGKISEEKVDKITSSLKEELIMWRNKEILFIEQIREKMEMIKKNVVGKGQNLDDLPFSQKCEIVRSIIERVVIHREKPRIKEVTVKIYSKVDNLVYVYKVIPSKGFTVNPKWDLVSQNEKWTLDDFIKSTVQGKQIKVIVNPKTEN